MKLFKHPQIKANWKYILVAVILSFIFGLLMPASIPELRPVLFLMFVSLCFVLKFSWGRHWLGAIMLGLFWELSYLVFLFRWCIIEEHSAIDHTLASVLLLTFLYVILASLIILVLVAGLYLFFSGFKPKKSTLKRTAFIIFGLLLIVGFYVMTIGLWWLSPFFFYGGG